MNLTEQDIQNIETAVEEGGDIWNNPLVKDFKDRVKTYYRTRDNEQCCYCKKNSQGEFKMVLDIEHILPKGQPEFREFMFVLTNLNVACKRCNMNVKGTSTDFVYSINAAANNHEDSNQYKFIHPNADDYFEHLEYIQRIDNDKKTLHITDQGLGMTAEEVEKYINQIAFSGAEEFVNKYQDKSEAIIGHFGLGFYSAFMVANNVEIISRSFQEGSTAVKWTCDGSPNYVIEDTEKEDRGTDIILHVGDDSTEFLEDSKITELLTKYNKFMPVPIKFGTKETVRGKINHEITEVVFDEYLRQLKKLITEIFTINIPFTEKEV